MQSSLGAVSGLLRTFWFYKRWKFRDWLSDDYLLRKDSTTWWYIASPQELSGFRRVVDIALMKRFVRVVGFILSGSDAQWLVELKLQDVCHEVSVMLHCCSKVICKARTPTMQEDVALLKNISRGSETALWRCQNYELTYKRPKITFKKIQPSSKM